MNAEKDNVSRALNNWARRMAASHRLQAEAYDLLVSSLEDEVPRPWTPASVLPLQERPQRQAILLAAVQERARRLKSSGVPRREWLHLASHFGYDTRGTAGFFRRSADGTDGLLARDEETDSVRLAGAGFSRMEEYERAIDEYKPSITAAVEDLDFQVVQTTV